MPSGCNEQDVQPPRHHAGLRALALATATIAAMSLGGCKTLSMDDITGSIVQPSATLPSAQEDVRAYTLAWEKRYDSRPGDKTAALAYARGLRALGQHEQAVAVVQKIALKFPEDMEILGAYGKALADAGRLSEAAEVLKQAHTPDRPNWSILSAQGSVADQMGDHRAAQGFYREALKINPGEPSVLSNLGLSLALSKRLDEAEETLRQASAHPRADQRVRQNLALVLALQGKFTEAEMISARDVSPEQAAANVATIRQMISQSNAWREIQKGDPQTAPATGAKAGQRSAHAAQADPAAAWTQAAAKAAKNQ
jgi:Flp pilus assembly protein TadD